MSLKLYQSLFAGLLLFTQITLAAVPVEIIGSCKNQRAVNDSVIFTKLISPSGRDDSPGCTDHFESTHGYLNFGAISCDDANYLILKSTRFKLSTAENHSINPAIAPGGNISPRAFWSKIVFNNVEYLCIEDELSPSGAGAEISQYYIVENAFNASEPILHYYFFNRDIMPMTSAN